MYQSDALSQKAAILGSFKNCLKTENTSRNLQEIKVQWIPTPYFFLSSFFSYSCKCYEITRQLLFILFFKVNIMQQILTKTKQKF